jgi:low iron-inducible protein
MKRTAAALAALGLLLAGCSDTGTVPPAAAAPTTTTTEPPVTPSGALGGYQPVSDVAQHAKMSADVCDINALLDASPIDFAALGAIYRDGRYSSETAESKRTLGKFAREPRSTEDLLGRYERYLGAAWLDAFTSAAIDGSGPFASEADLVRRQGVQKGVRNQILVAWALHELDAAVDKAGKASFVKKTGAPHNWDEAWAYYRGEKPECAAYATADERGKEFGTGSAVNEAILAAMNQGLKALLAKSTTGAAKARDEVARQITITYVQSAIKYAAEVDAALAQGKADEARVWQAEGWAYFRVIEPLIARVNTTAARTVAEVLDLKAQPAAGSGEKVASALAKAYDALGIRPAEVGQYRAS